MPASARMTRGPGCNPSCRRTSSPMMRCNIRQMPVTAPLRSSSRGRMVSRRPNRSSWRVRLAARSAAVRISPRCSSTSGGRFFAIRASSACMITTVRMLLKSCATPPASCPMASSFCAWRNWSSIIWRSSSTSTRETRLTMARAKVCSSAVHRRSPPTCSAQSTPATPPETRIGASRTEPMSGATGSLADKTRVQGPGPASSGPPGAPSARARK